MNATTIDMSQAETPIDQLERKLIVEFVREQGYNPLEVYDLSAQERLTLMRGASMYASDKLAEVEARAHFLVDLRGRRMGY